MARREEPRIGVIVSRDSLDSQRFHLLNLAMRCKVSMPLMILPDNWEDIRANSPHSETEALLAYWVRHFMKEHRLDGIMVDVSEMDAFDAARAIGVRPYLYSDSSMITLWNRLNVAVESPGFIPQNPNTDRNEGIPRHFSEHFREAKGILVNSFSDLEPAIARALKEPGLPPVYPVGPLTLAGSTGGVVDEECLRWLDEQPPGSVLSVSFGALAQQSREQINEVALALEMSRQRFVWVVGIFDDFLRPDFRDRVRNVAFVGQSSAPQSQILAHKSIGGLLTDCEWPAAMESIAHGVPLIALPLSSEQKTNAVMLARVGVGVRPNADENGLVGSEGIAAAIKVLMEGEDGRMVRDQMQMLKESAARALTEGGSSNKALAQVANQWKSKEHSLLDLLLFFVAFYIVSELILSVGN